VAPNHPKEKNPKGSLPRKGKKNQKKGGGGQNCEHGGGGKNVLGNCFTKTNLPLGGRHTRGKKKKKKKGGGG